MKNGQQEFRLGAERNDRQSKKERTEKTLLYTYIVKRTLIDSLKSREFK